MKKLEYIYPFTGWGGLDLPCCFASLYMYLEKTENYEGGDEYDCPKQLGKPCDTCCCCGDKLKIRDGRLWMTFDTVIGRAATVTGWENTKTAIFNEVNNTDDSLDFLMGYTGYDYESCTDKDLLSAKIRRCIEDGMPVLTRIEGKEEEGQVFRVITGYDGDTFFVAEKTYGTDEKDKSDFSLTAADIKKIYIITGKTACRYTRLDALKRIKRVMEADRANCEWDKYINAFSDYWDKLENADIKELKQRFWYLHKGMIFNCHILSHAVGLWVEFKRPDFQTALDRLFTATAFPTLINGRVNRYGAQETGQKGFLMNGNGACVKMQ